MILFLHFRQQERKIFLDVNMEKTYSVLCSIPERQNVSLTIVYYRVLSKWSTKALLFFLETPLRGSGGRRHITNNFEWSLDTMLVD